GDIDGGLTVFMDALEGPGSWQRLPATSKQLLRDNATTLIGQTRDKRPPFSKADAAAITTPTLFIGGAKTKGALPQVLHTLAAHPCGLLRREHDRRQRHSARISAKFATKFLCQRADDFLRFDTAACPNLVDQRIALNRRAREICGIRDFFFLSDHDDVDAAEA